MGLLSMSANEHKLSERYIAEGIRLLGEECLMYFPEEITTDLHQDRDIVYGDPRKMNILFETHPEPILKNNNWYSEDSNYEPYVVYVTNLDDNYERVEVQRDCIIEISSIQVSEVVSKKFIITHLAGSKINPLFWTCKIVPYREKSKKEEVQDYEAPSNTDMGYSFIRRDPK